MFDNCIAGYYYKYINNNTQKQEQNPKLIIYTTGGTFQWILKTVTDDKHSEV